MEEIKNVDKADADSFAEALRGLLSHRTHAVMGDQVPASADKEDPVAKIKR